MDNYIDKVKKFNKKIDYTRDINTARLVLEYCIPLVKSKKIFFVGTGLGGDSKIVKNIRDFEIIGIEPRETFQEHATKQYNKIGAKLYKKNLGDFVKIFKKLSGIIFFIHSINHISKNQILAFEKITKKSYIIIINPNPQIERVVGKTDNTVISYLNSKQIQKLLNAEIIFNFFYNSVKIKNENIFLREIIVLKKN
jgi:hypothetical protein